MRLCVLGLGYIGLPTALLLSQKHQVVGVDINQKIVNTLNSGKLPFNEPGLDELLTRAHGNFSAAQKVVEADVFIIAVPTPLEGSMKIADLKYVRSAAEMISLHLKDDNLVILESTVPPGTSERLVIPILRRSGLKTFYFSHCPERAIPGNTIFEIVNNDRIIGGIDKTSNERTKAIYASFVKGNIYLTDAKTAEFVKLMENTFRDVNIALANEFAQIAEESNVDVWAAIELANKHPRVKILKPGPGVGGHCIAIDPWFLTENSTKFKIIPIARQINDSMPNNVLLLVRKLLKELKEPTIAVLGVAYKGDIGDARETPAMKFIKLAENEGFVVKVHDPYVKEFDYKILGAEDAVKDSDCIILITDHNVFKEIDPVKMAKLVRKKNLVDTRNILDHEKWRKAGFTVEVLGKISH
ncbi:MAG: nucleotide sugar dehydrogenase [Euryarchaeota archaeon]|nr:nucleotide sugar dehydrogenase [Euryarchaeota archaeon]